MAAVLALVTLAIVFSIIIAIVLLKNAPEGTQSIPKPGKGSELIQRLASETHDAVIEAHKQFGDSVILPFDGSDTVFVRSPLDVRTVLSSTAPSTGLKWEYLGVMARASNLLQPMALGTFFHMPTGAEWRQQRRSVAPVFSLPTATSYALELAAELPRTLESEEGPVDAQQLMHDLLRDTMFVTGLGRLPTVEEKAAFQELATLSEAPMDSVTDEALEAAVVATIRVLSTSVDEFAEHRPKERTFMAGLMLDAGHDSEAIARALHNLIVAGAESNAASLARTLACVAEDPSIQQRLVDELQTVLDGNAPSTPKDLSSLTYLDAVVREGLRRFAPATVVVRCFAEPTTLHSGAVVQAGQRLAVCIPAVHMNEEHWPEPQRFLPSRFLDSTPASNTYLPFSLGKRACPGKNMAILQAKAVIATLLSSMRVERAHDASSLDDHVPRFSGWGNEGVPIVFHRR